MAFQHHIYNKPNSIFMLLLLSSFFLCFTFHTSAVAISTHFPSCRKQHIQRRARGFYSLGKAWEWAEKHETCIESTHETRELSQVHTYRYWKWFEIWRMFDGICGWICHCLMEKRSNMVELLSKVMCVVALRSPKNGLRTQPSSRIHTYSGARRTFRLVWFFFAAALL